MPTDTRHRERLDTGLYRRTTGTGDTRYDVVVWQGGRQQVRALPRGTSEREARKAALRARAAASTGTAPLALAHRLEAVVAEYLEQAENRTRIVGKGRMSETTVGTYRTRLRDYVTPTIGRRKLSELGKADVLRVLDRCHEAGLSEWATHGVLTAFRAVLRFARELDYMTADPFASVQRDRLPARKAQSEPRALRHEDAALLLAQLRGKRDKALGCLLVDAGLRVSEACGLTWGDVGLVDRVLHVRGQLAPLKPGEAARIVPPKSPRSVRTVPLLPRLQESLEALYAGEGDAELVLRTKRGTPLSRHNARRSIREAGEKAKLGHVTPHVLRRTTGTALSEARVPEAAAAAMMGHSLEVFHGTYVKAHRDVLERDRARDALVELGLGVSTDEEGVRT
ncbi:MAG: site-specific integrase [Actinobacteria bacterium]|nr:site-specific integrase [Actinomycetota bacterium]